MKSPNTLQELKELITAGEAWDLAHMMAQVFAFEGAPKRNEGREVELQLFSSVEFEREENLQPSITLCVDSNQVAGWIYEDLNSLKSGVIPSVSAFFEAFGLKAGSGEYTEKFNDFLFTKDQVVQLREWKEEDHPYLDDDVELRDYLYLLLMERLDLSNASEPYNSIIFDWLKL